MKRVSQASIANAGAATKTGTGVNMIDLKEGVAHAKITNGATGPTAPCTMALQVSMDGTTYAEVYKKSGGSTNNAVTHSELVTVPACKKARWVFTGNDDQAVTVEGHVYARER